MDKMKQLIYGILTILLLLTLFFPFPDHSLASVIASVISSAILLLISYLEHRRLLTFWTVTFFLILIFHVWQLHRFLTA